MRANDQNGAVETERLIETLVRDGTLLGATAERAGVATPVPSCPGWTVRDLLAHIGFVHRWATSIVAEQRPEPPDGIQEVDVLAIGPEGEAVLEWYRDGHLALVTALRSAPDSLSCWAFFPAPSPRAFWSRRQAHETAMHRADAQLAAGAPSPFEADFAADGVDELLMGFAPTRRSKARSPKPRTLLVRATDTADAWRVHFGPERVETERGEGPADAVLAAPASDLYLLLWNRPPSSAPDVEGSSDLVDLWHENLRVRW